METFQNNFITVLCRPRKTYIFLCLSQQIVLQCIGIKTIQRVFKDSEVEIFLLNWHSEVVIACIWSIYIA